MRTTLTIDDQLIAALKKRAYETGKTFKEIVNETLRAGLAGTPVAKPKPYTLKPVAMGQPRAGINLDKATQLAGELEDDELARKLELRK